MIPEEQLKQNLQSLAKNEYQLTEADDLETFLQAMVTHIGSLDPELRDDLIYTTFVNLIYRQQAFSAGQLRYVLQKVLDEEHLFYGIGEQDTDSVFTRTFSVLLLPLILIAHRRQPFLSPLEVGQVQQSLLRYLHEERDRRGYVQGKGWAHAIAHAADALDDLAQCVELGADELREILHEVRSLVCIADTVYTHGEDERLVTPVIAILRRELLPEEEIIRWVEGFSEAVLVVEDMPARLYIQGNVSNFLQALFFRLTWAHLSGPLGAAITETLREMNRFAGD